MEQIRRSIQRVSVRWEFSFVVFISLGYFVLGSVLHALFPSPKPPITQAGLVHLLTYECITLLILGGLLHVRGWSVDRIGLKPTLRDTFIGLGLMLAI